ncbi:MAG: type II toxin-antitoxin system Phd/YefM family antitoxin [Phycicoccus sp.]
MSAVTVRDLRNHGSEVLDRVARGETVTVTRNGVEIAEVRPLARRSPSPAELIARRRRLPLVDPDAWRHDIDAGRDPALRAPQIEE